MAACLDYAKRVPNVKTGLCEQADWKDSGGRSVLGRTIWVRDIPARERSSTGPLKILVLGGIHGDEMSSVSTAFHWIPMAAEGLSGASAIDWRFVPALNPDGLFMKPSRRVNANGVDLNRNFPTPNWNKDARIYWEKRTRRDPRRWPGKTSLSEPESRYLHGQMNSFKPNLIVSIHAPFGLLDFDGPPAPPSKLGRLYLDQVGIYPGSLGNYGGIHKGVPVVTIELPSATKSPLDGDVRLMWVDLLSWIDQKLAPGIISSKAAGSTNPVQSPPLLPTQ